MSSLAPAMNWRIVAALACLACAGSPALAAHRHAPHGSQSAAPGPGAAGGTPPAGHAKPDGGDASGPHDAASKGPDHNGKATDGKPVGQIDLTRPDDGYGNQGRHAARPLFIAPHGKPAVGSTTVVAPHPPAITALDHTRNAAGATVPVGPVPPAVVGAVRPEQVHLESAAFGSAKNNLGLGGTAVHPAPVHIVTTPAPPKPPVIGINGTTLHSSGGGIGGPAKDHSAIAGSSYKHK
jgi:hypothetical protein